MVNTGEGVGGGLQLRVGCSCGWAGGQRAEGGFTPRLGARRVDARLQRKLTSPDGRSNRLDLARFPWYPYTCFISSLCAGGPVSMWSGDVSPGPHTWTPWPLTKISTARGSRVHSSRLLMLLLVLRARTCELRGARRICFSSSPLLERRRDRTGAGVAVGVPGLPVGELVLDAGEFGEVGRDAPLLRRAANSEPMLVARRSSFGLDPDLAGDMPLCDSSWDLCQGHGAV